ncbi:bifunctional DedA family/phosphatase PAP2 family protein [Roseibium aestuarii]|uniref:VTT domain-containing protein n=1 Tax=Roseibium aestuarii TaxID=2600299 RepID=A0ABW4K3M8_9HYPH|nr:bifunctional DedA family/phosphatase PAP2 family protein [Roseibium aestuarii]
MTAIFENLVGFIGDNPALAGLICFAAAMGEALFIIGLVVPSTVVLVGAGTLIGLGKLDAVSIFIWTTLGATVGDALSYWFGYFYKDKVRKLWPLSRYSSLMDRGEEFFRQHGGKSVFIGRFVPGVKSVVPGIAGMVGMNATRFTIINVTSAFVWALAHLGPGILAGSALGAIGQVSGRLAFVLGGLCVVTFVTIMLGRWLILIIMPLFPNTHSVVVSWLARRPDRVSRWIAEALDPENPRSTGMLLSAALLLVTMPLFFWFMGEIAPGEPMVRADVAILNLFDSLRSPIGDKLMVIVTLLGDGIVVTLVATVIIAYLFLRKAWRRATGVLIAIGGTALFVPLIKALLERSRPMDLYTGAQMFSFPSGHATLNTVLFGICAVLIAHDRSRWAKASIFTVTAIYVIAMAFSRVYLGAHWLSDVLAGLMFGTAMVAAFAFVFSPVHNEKLGRITLAGMTVASLALFGSWHVMRALPSAMETYAPRSEIIRMTGSTWRGFGWSQLPAQRIELSGETKEPLVMQYAGDPKRLIDKLAGEGWRPAPEWTLSSASGFVEGQTPAEDLPAFPRTQNGRQPALTLIRKDEGAAPSDSRWVMRLWPSRYAVLEGRQLLPLYTGSVLHEEIIRPMGEFSGPKTDRQTPEPKDNPLSSLSTSLQRERPNGETVVLAVEPSDAIPDPLP